MSASIAVSVRARRVVTALTVVLALCFGICAAATPASASTPLTARFALNISGNILRMMNQERAAHHLPPLKMQWRLVNAAAKHNQLMAAANTMSHQLPGEAPLGNRISATGFRWTWAGENVGWNSDMSLKGVRYLEQVMYDEKPPGEIGHRLNILSSQYRYVGINVRWDFAHHKVWLTEDFARNAS